MSPSASASTSNRQKRIAAALREDIGNGDITSIPIFPRSHKSNAVLIAKGNGVLAGIAVAKLVCQTVDATLQFRPLARDGQTVMPGDTVLRLAGSTLSILQAERTMLNFLQRLSGIATLTALFVKATKGTRAKILDTRKTTPLWRDLEKAAVRAGGGHNHRMGLYDAVLIKDNHIDAAGSISAAVAAVRKNRRGRVFIEVEARSMDEVKEAYASKVDRVMLDNMTPAQMSRAVRWLKSQKAPRPKTEASGGIGLHNTARIAGTGVDFISIGALTHSAPILDLSLRIEKLSA